MAIQQRRGAKADFDATKMLPGELAVTTDGSRKVYVAFAPGDAKELASTEDVEETIQSGIEEIEQKKEEALAQFPNYEDKLAELEVYKANSIISKASGEVITTTDSAKAKPKNIKLFGKGKQRQYEGNQLANFNDFVGTTKSDCYVREFKLIAGTMTMGIELENNSSGAHIDFVNDNGEKITSVGATIDGNTFQLTQEQVDAITQINLFVYVEYAGSKVKSVMLNEGDTLKPYEPYVGGEPSPNMNYPQEVECLGESGSIKQSIYNKNLYCGRYYYLAYTNGIGILRNKDEVAFPYNPKVETDGVAKIVPCHAGKTYTMSVRGVNENCVYGITEYDSIESAFKSSNAIGYCVYGTSSYTKSYTAKQNGILLCGVAGKWTDGNTTIHVCTEDEEVQVEIGEVATEYEEPVDVQEFTFQTPNGLRGIPLGQTIPDAIKNSPIHMNGVYWDNVEQQYYIADTKNENGKDVQRIGKYNFTGEENMEKRGVTTFDLYQTHLNDLDFGNASIVLPMFCTHFAYDNYITKSNTVYSMGHGYVSFSFAEYGTTTVDDIKKAFAEKYAEGNPVEITYILAEPIITESTDQYDVIMNYPNTTIVNDAGAYMEVEYVADTKKHIEQNYVSKEAHQEHENRIAELEKAIVNS